MKVKAIKNGFFVKYRRPGDEFTIETDKQFSKVWMVKLEDEVKKTKAVKKAKVTK